LKEEPDGLGSGENPYDDKFGKPGMENDIKLGNWMDKGIDRKMSTYDGTSGAGVPKNDS